MSSQDQGQLKLKVHAAQHGKWGCVKVQILEGIKCGGKEN